MPSTHKTLLTLTPPPAELLALGNAHLKISPTQITLADLLQSYNYFLRALPLLQASSFTTPKQAARLYQKLMQACLSLSQKSPDAQSRMSYADDAMNYGTAALQNARRTGDAFMIAQVEFLVACVKAWSVYMRAKDDRVWDVAAVKEAEEGLVERLSALQGFGRLEMSGFELQARKFGSDLERLSQGLP